MSEALKNIDQKPDVLSEAIHDLEEVIVLARTTVDAVSSGPDKLNLACTMSSGVLRKLSQIKEKLERRRLIGERSR